MGRPFHAGSQATQEEGQDTLLRKEATITRWSGLLAGRMAEFGEDAVSSVLDWMYAHRRTAYKMRVEEPAASLGRTPTSKLGGLPFLLPGESWPRSTHSDDEGAELMFVWQFQVSEMPAAMRSMLGVAEGSLFQFFLDEELPGFDINKDKGYYLVRILTPEQLEAAEADTHTPQAEPGSGTKVLPEKVVLGWDEVEDWPSYEDWNREGDAPDKPAFDRILDILNDAGSNGAPCAGGDKALGWPNWCQGPEWGEVEASEEGGPRQQYLQFMQFEAEHCGNDFCVGDAGTLVIQRDPLNQDPPDFLVGWACC